VVAVIALAVVAHALAVANTLAAADSVVVVNS
jgi:hypothetical protein